MNKKVYAACMASIATMTMSICALASNSTPIASITEAPPARFAGFHRQIATSITKGYQRGAVSWQHRGKPSLTISWVARAGSLPAGTIIPAGERHPFPQAREKQVFPTKGFVTAVRMIDANTLIVAEVSDWSPAGKTSLYIQPLIWPGLMPNASIDIVTGEAFVAVTQPKLGKKKYLYSDLNTSGKFGIRNIWNQRVGQDPDNVVGFFFQFDDTGELHQVAKIGGPVRQVAWTNNAPSGELECAGLSEFRWDYMTAMLKSNVMVYFAYDPDDNAETLVMSDVDLNGTIDSISVLNSTAVDALFGAEFGWPLIEWLAD